MTEYQHWNDPNVLPPVGCPLVLSLGPEYDHDIAFGERLDHLAQRDRQMTYLLNTGQLITGRYSWTYP